MTMIKLVRNYKDLTFPDETVEQGYDVIFEEGTMTLADQLDKTMAYIDKLELEVKRQRAVIEAHGEVLSVEYRNAIIEECLGALDKLKQGIEIDEAHYQAIGWAQETLLALRK